MRDIIYVKARHYDSIKPHYMVQPTVQAKVSPTVLPEAPQQASESTKKRNSPKKSIPKHVKTLVWDKYIGSDKAEAACCCCLTTPISIRNFHCGHVISEANGGDLTIQNLRPICAPCNLSMGRQNMNDFTKTYFGWSV